MRVGSFEVLGAPLASGRSLKFLLRFSQPVFLLRLQLLRRYRHSTVQNFDAHSNHCSAR